MTSLSYSREQAQTMAAALRSICNLEQSNPATYIALKAMNEVSGLLERRVIGDLTPRQAEVLKLIEDFRNEHGYSISVREIGDAFDIKSPNGVMCHLQALARKGYIRHSPNKSRSIVVIY